MEETININIYNEISQVEPNMSLIVKLGNFGIDGTPPDILTAAEALKAMCERTNTKEASISEAKNIQGDLAVFINSASDYLRINNQNEDITQAISALEEVECYLRDKITLYEGVVQQRKIKLELPEINKNLTLLGARLESIEKGIDTSGLPDLKAISDDAAREITTLLGNLRGSAEQASNKIIQGQYIHSAQAEKKASDDYRNYSVTLMIFAFLLPLSTILEKSLLAQSDNLSWESIALRLIASFLLSIPAAYMARESSRHRRQQYLYQQYALNLEAVNPFIAELELKDKNALKADLARKLFTASHESGSSGVESYPINIHELLALLISRIEVRPGSNPDSNRN